MIIEIPAKSLGVIDDNLKNNIYLTLLKDEIIKDIRYEDVCWKIIEEKMQGVVLDDNNNKQIVIFTPKINNLDISKKFQTEGRNTFLLQNFFKCYCYSIENNINNLSYSINFNNVNDIDNSEYDKSKLLTKSLIFNLKELSTLNIKINKSLMLFLENKKLDNFSSLMDFLDSKYITKNKIINKQSLKWSMNADENVFCVYSKNTGATRGELLTFLLVVDKFLKNTNYKIKLFSLDNNKKYEKISGIFSNNVIFEDLNRMTNDLEVIVENANDNDYLSNEEYITRSQEIFKNNIIKKYFNEEDFEIDRCFCCNYILERSLIRSHIHRFIDIQKDLIDKKLSKEEAMKLNLSGSNGFLLCPNHDKMFEYGEILFDLDYQKNNTNKPFVINKNNKYLMENKHVLEFIESSFQQHPNMFKSIVVEPEFISNVKKHHERINSKKC